VADKAQLASAPARVRTSRKEAKRRTRERLLTAASRTLLSHGEESISAIAVARAAGVANATFYEHFDNRDDLLRTLAEGLFAQLRAELEGPRREALQAPSSEERLRRQFRVPLQDLVDRGYPAATPLERRRLEMIADINIASVEALTLGHLSGRYPDLEEVVDMLVLVSHGTRLVRERAEVGTRAR